MNIQEVEEEVRKVNDYLSMCLWMDFEICKMDGYSLLVSGSLDESKPSYAIDIEFIQPYYVSSIFEWHLDTKTPFLSIVTQEEITDIKFNFVPDPNYFVFKMNTGYQEIAPMYVVAKEISCNIINEKPFG